MNNWELLIENENASTTMRLKVEGGYLYLIIIQGHRPPVTNMCFVPDNGLEVYGHHIKEAFNQGYDKGKQETLEAIRSQHFFVEGTAPNAESKL